MGLRTPKPWLRSPLKSYILWIPPLVFPQTWPLQEAPEYSASAGFLPAVPVPLGPQGRTSSLTTYLWQEAH